MNINNAFPSKYLKASDLRGKKIPVEIESVSQEKIGDDQKIIVYFVDREKGLVLNKTNANTIAAVHGPETDAWIGKTIHLYSAKVSYNGQMVDALRIENPAEFVADDDDIPF